MAVIRDVIAPFELFQPASIDDAIRLLDKYGADALVLAGGLDSMDWLKDRLRRPKAVVDLGQIQELHGIPADIGQFTDAGMTDPDVGAKTFEAVIGRKPTAIEPTLLHALGHGPAIGLELAGAHMMVPALVMEHEEAHGLGMPAEQAGIEHEDARRRDAEIGQARVEHVAYAAAAQHPTGDRHGPIALLADRRGRLDWAAARARPRESRRQTCAKARPTHADAPPTISPRRYAGK